jgi:hypothetical protein
VEKMSMPSEEIGMTKDVFAGVLTGLVESIHVELPDEAVDVPVPEEFGEDVVLKLINFLDGKLASVGHPVDNRLVFLVLEDLKALLDEVCN